MTIWANIFFQLKMFLLGVVSELGKTIDRQVADSVVLVGSEAGEVFFSNTVGEMLVCQIVGMEGRVASFAGPDIISDIEIIVVAVSGNIAGESEFCEPKSDDFVAVMRI